MASRIILKSNIYALVAWNKPLAFFSPLTREGRSRWVAGGFFAPVAAKGVADENEAEAEGQW